MVLRITSFILGILLLHTNAVHAATCDSPPQRLQIAPGATHIIAFAAGSHGMLIEEFGADLLYRFGSDEPLTEISISPPRLGIAAVRARAPSITVQQKTAHAPAEIIVRSHCASHAELLFFELLEGYFSESISKGATKAAAAVEPLRASAKEAENPLHRAWLLHAWANALLATGKHTESAMAFLEARVAWRAINDHPRAAVALMAAGEDYSRSSELDLAESVFTTAEQELAANGPTYYQLRTRAAMCLVTSRRGHKREAVSCESVVADRLESLGEFAEAGARGVSIANKLTDLGLTVAAKERLVRVSSNEAALSPIARAKLRAAYGHYQLSVGNPDRAALEFQSATTGFGTLGYPRDQANIDLKLARLAHDVGAYREELRLLERARSAQPSLEKQAAIDIRLANAALELGDSAKARRHLQSAWETCQAKSMSECLETATIFRILSSLRIGELNEAREFSASLGETILAANRITLDLARAELVLREGDPTTALILLKQIESTPARYENAVRKSILIARALNAVEADDLARDQLRNSFTNLASSISKLSTSALRFTAHQTLRPLREEYFDSTLIKEHPTPEEWESLSLFLELSAIHNHLSTQNTRTRLTTTQRADLSTEILGRTNQINQRDLFLALVSPQQNEQSKQTNNKRKDPDRSGKKQPDTIIQLAPLLGRKTFRVAMLNAGRGRICISLSRSEYDLITEQFEGYLNRRNNDLAELDLEAQRWYDLIRKCYSGRSSPHWEIISGPEIGRFPWPWIAARAEQSGDEEPTVTYVTRIGTEPPVPIIKPNQAAIINLAYQDEYALPFTSIEASAVTAILKSVGIPLISQPQTQSLQTLHSIFAGDQNWIHIVGHGNAADHGSLYAGLWLPSRDGVSIIMHHELTSAQFNAPLAIISACGGSAKSASDRSPLLLANALLTSGTKNIIANTNYTSDVAAAYWVPRLLQFLVSDGLVAEATLRARQSLRRTVHFRNPRHWAGIVNLKK